MTYLLAHPIALLWSLCLISWITGMGFLSDQKWFNRFMFLTLLCAILATIAFIWTEIIPQQERIDRLQSELNS